MTVDDFKSIYMWEWSHRILGRIIGLTFLAPIPYFIYRRKLARGAALSLFAIASLIGGQGALGWYMVKSGLDAESVKDLGGVPRVSQYRLAAHLGMAFLVYAACLRMGLGVGRDWKIVKKMQGLGGWKTVEETLRGLNSKAVGRVRVLTTALTGLVFLTALSGVLPLFPLSPTVTYLSSPFRRLRCGS
jgi:cytochrome c oxidase assembly protein subunit 15